MAADIQPWLSSLALVVSVAGTLYAWITARSRGNAEQIATLEKRVNKHDRQLDQVETTLQHLPSKDMTQRMELTLSEVRGEIAVLSERLQPVSSISERLQDFLLEQAKK
ncbi:DUF2730 family protein [Kaustia mangrovi]|uniref:DUF2730 family protein n=1 Tax=Kaustia mangrovi TaxID=2593653 RepID=A0A7S8C7G8_9HYPH|nr:DUF2730 family protein [Kaustia mangrovi]QPC44614.1 DUF2730 family protein [Kaustia mangrovi]